MTGDVINDAKDGTSYIDLNGNGADKSDTTDIKASFCQKLNLF